MQDFMSLELVRILTGLGVTNFLPNLVNLESARVLTFFGVLTFRGY